MTNSPDSTATCPRCGGEINAHAKFCMHCGSALQASQPAPVQPYPATRTCSACQQEVPVGNAFCVHCGQNMNAPVASAQPTATIQCSVCGRQNAANMRFCGGCGSSLSAPQQSQYPQQYAQQPYVQQGQYAQPAYGQAQYQQPQYPQQYNQSGYQQQPMTLRCPVCMAMAPLGTSNCPGCRTNLAGVVPTPMNMPVQGQQGMLGGIGNMFQGNGGNMAMGALGGAAAVIGGEMLLHGVENSIENRVEGDMGYGGYEHHRHYRREDEGLLGGLGDLANDVGLF